MSTISVLLTGGTGFLGSAIVDSLQEKHPEWSVAVLDLQYPVHARTNVEYRIADVTCLADIRSVVDEMRPDIIIHTAGLIPGLSSRYERKSRERVFEVNVEGTRKMLSMAKEYGTKAFVWTSSVCSVTDDMKYQYANMDETWPTSSHSLIYGESKAVAEELVLKASDETLATCALRAPVMFGPEDYQLIPSIHACIAKRETPFVIGTGENLWDVMYVNNCADAHVLAAENLVTSGTAAGEAFFVSNKEPIPFRDLCLAVWAHFGHYPPFELHIPQSLAVFAGHLAESVTWLRGHPTTLSSGSVLDACAMRYCNTHKVEKILGFKPRIGIEEGIQLSCEAYARKLRQKSVHQLKLANGHGDKEKPN